MLVSFLQQGDRPVIRFRLRQAISQWEYREQRRLTLTELGEATGIVRTSLSRMTGPKPFNSTTNNVDALCKFFGCTVADLLEYVPDPAVEPAPPVAKGGKGRTARPAG